MHMLEGVRERLHLRPGKESDERTVDDLHVANSTEINTQANKLPEKVNINDPRLVKLVAGLHELNISPVKEPIPLDRIGGSKKTSRVVVDIDSLTPGSEPTEYSVPIPVGLFVAAPEISDWRRGRRSPKNGRRSSSIIREYSHLSAKTAPPIHGVTVYTREDGSIFAVLYGDGAHRLCAAKRRGDNDILCTKLNIIQID